MKLKRTDEINRALTATPSEKTSLTEQDIGEEWIDHCAAIKLGKRTNIPLSVLFKGTEVYFDPPPAPPAKSPEYLAFIDRLRREEEERQYKALVDDGHSVDPSLNIKSVTKEVNEQLTTIFNILVSIVAVAWAFWYWCGSWSLGARTLMSLFAGLVTGVAEVVVYSGYMRRVEEVKSRKHDHTETRRVTREIIFHDGKEITKSYPAQPETEDHLGKKEEKPANDETKPQLRSRRKAVNA